MTTGVYREVVEYVDFDRQTRFGVERLRYWTSDGEIYDREWLGTYENRCEAESVMLAGVCEDEAA